MRVARVAANGARGCLCAPDSAGVDLEDSTGVALRDASLSRLRVGPLVA